MKVCRLNLLIFVKIKRILLFVRNMNRKYNWKKWPLVIIVTVFMVNFWQHQNYKKNVAKTFSESLIKANYNIPKVDQVKLSLGFTFLGLKTSSEIFYDDSGDTKSVFVIATPIGKLPLIWFLIDSTYHLDIMPEELDKLSIYKK